MYLLESRAGNGKKGFKCFVRFVFLSVITVNNVPQILRVVYQSPAQTPAMERKEIIIIYIFSGIGPYGKYAFRLPFHSEQLLF